MSLTTQTTMTVRERLAPLAFLVRASRRKTRAQTRPSDRHREPLVPDEAVRLALGFSMLRR